MMHGHEKSDSVIVAVKPANKAVHPAAEQSAAEAFAAEPGEPRAETKGNADQQTMPWAQSQTSMPRALDRIREVARERKKEKFISLFHHISIDLLAEAFYQLEVDAAPGVDRLMWKDYEAEFEGFGGRGAGAALAGVLDFENDFPCATETLENPLEHVLGETSS